jgi:WD repeat-containing protein 23
MAADIQTSGFPPGYFIIRSLATDRLLDIEGDGIEGSLVVLREGDISHQAV